MSYSHMTVLPVNCPYVDVKIHLRTYNVVSAHASFRPALSTYHTHVGVRNQASYLAS